MGPGVKVTVTQFWYTTHPNMHLQINLVTPGVIRKEIWPEHTSPLNGFIGQGQIHKDKFSDKIL